MRYAIASSILLGLIATGLPGSNAGVLPSRLKCHNENCTSHDSIEWSVTYDFHRRAGGGGGKGSHSEDSPSGGTTGGGGSGIGGSGNSEGEGVQSGEVGGFGAEETEGGFGANCAKKRSWPYFWRRNPASCQGESPPNAPPPPAGPAGPESGPENNPAEKVYPPSTRNNQNQPATSPEGIFTPKPEQKIDDKKLLAQMKGFITSKDLQGQPFLFYSGYEDRKAFLERALELISRKPSVTRILKQEGKPDREVQLREGDGNEDAEIPAMGHLMEDEGVFPQADRALEDNPGYFWNVFSAVYSQAVSGRILLVVPPGRPVNQPYKEKGSVWWSFEAPHLTRNDGVTEIKLLTYDDSTTGDPFGTEQVIWRQGDEPLGTIAEPQYEVALPDESWYPPT